MWKFKAFCLDYWHVLCLHPHNNFYKRYVSTCPRSAGSFDLDRPRCSLCYVSRRTSDDLSAGGTLMSLPVVKCSSRSILWSACWRPGRPRETLLRGVRAARAISDFSECSRLQLLCRGSARLSNLAVGTILFVLVVCVGREHDELARAEFIHSRCPTGSSPLSPFTHCCSISA